jgi:hypothetical protein
LGINISDNQKNQEINTLLADLFYRCISGEFSDPDLNGFIASDKPLWMEWEKNLIKLYKGL